ncbi:fatty acid desaturase family protein [Streptomyces catenulae]|uniref:Fatty acid desaturase n=1 Tax=Streptomyces catenulae TaxID=66875 RepID=A0ABV2YZ81_9ACTN|nr:fatty acid desaturase [Streptomyces catenulae]
MSGPTPRQGIDRRLLHTLATPDRVRVTGRAAVLLAGYAGVARLALWQGSVGWALLCSAVLGFLLAGFINAAHDCVHSSHLRSKRANRIAGAAWSTPILLNFTIYRHQHLVHHRFTGVEGDTEPEETFTSLRAYLYALSGVPFWPGLLRRIWKTWRGDFPASVHTADRRRTARQNNAVICAWLALMAALTVVFPYPLLIVYWLPLALSFPAGTFLSLPEHYGLWGVPEVSRNTRTVRSNAVVRYVVWNANYHAEHHRYPAVSSINLHRLHRAMPEPHPIQEKSYVRFHAGLFAGLGRGGQDVAGPPVPRTPSSDN